ncbi:hypothetical protein [Streptomyces sp. NPDC058964]|uniref:hypothetical protein n=1 Tax=Streptomyces sp. NPDC058964 TaxID=3346681 RepID=UPI0036AA85DB
MPVVAAGLAGRALQRSVPSRPRAGTRWSTRAETVSPATVAYGSEVPEALCVQTLPPSAARTAYTVPRSVPVRRDRVPLA